MWSCGTKPTSICSRITKNGKNNFYLANSCNSNEFSRKMGNDAFLDFEISIFFRFFDLTIQQDKKGLAFFCRKYVLQFLHRKVISERGNTGCILLYILIYAAYRYACYHLCWFHVTSIKLL